MDVDAARASDQAPLLVLRHVCADRLVVAARVLSRCAGRPTEGVWWELADPWSGTDAPPAAVAVTRSVGGVVELLEVAGVGPCAKETGQALLHQLVAVLRRADAAVISCSIRDPLVRGVLLGHGFVPLPDAADETKHPTRGERLILQL